MSNLKHGMKRTRIYGVWSAMKSRCMNPNRDQYEDYGGRGIKVCARWAESFENFYADMGDPPRGHTLDRRDNDGDYCPENCQWSPRTTQGRNKRTTRMLTAGGETKSIAEWSEVSGIPLKTICKRIASGWSDEDAVKTALITKRKGIPRGIKFHKVGAEQAVEWSESALRGYEEIRGAA